MGNSDKTQIFIPLAVIVALLAFGYFARGSVRQAFSGTVFKQPGDATVEGRYPKAENEEDCLENGGTWELLENDDNLCVYYFDDGGKECTHSDQCNGLCIVREPTAKDEKTIGSCTESSLVSGCYSEIGRYKKTGAIDCN